MTDKPDVLGGLLNGESPPSTSSQTPCSSNAETANVQCSRRGCQSVAQWQLLWNNPKIHTPDRRKIWLACTEHRDWLAGFLEARSLLKSIEPLDEDS